MKTIVFVIMSLITMCANAQFITEIPEPHKTRIMMNAMDVEYNANRHWWDSERYVKPLPPETRVYLRREIAAMDVCIKKGVGSPECIKLQIRK